MMRMLFGAMFGLLLLGCAMLPRGEGVALNVVQFRPLPPTLLETGVEVTLRVTNETTKPLALTGSTHRLYLNDTYVGRGVTNQRLTVPELGTSTQTVTIYLENLTLMRKFSEYSNAPPPTIGYRLESQLHPDNGIGSFKTGTNGHLDLRGLAEMMPMTPMTPTTPTTGR